MPSRASILRFLAGMAADGAVAYGCFAFTPAYLPARLLAADYERRARETSEASQPSQAGAATARKHSTASS